MRLSDLLTRGRALRKTDGRATATKPKRKRRRRRRGEPVRVWVPNKVRKRMGAGR